MSFSNNKLELAYEHLDKSDLRTSIVLFEELSLPKVENEQPEIYTQALLGLAEAYTDLGTYHLSIETLNRLLIFLDSKQPEDYFMYAKAHRLLVENYDFLFLHKKYLYHVNEFIRYYRLSDPDFKLYEAVYHAYLGRYYNLKFDINKAYEHTSKALNIYHKNRRHSNFKEIYKLYESHCFTLRNYPVSESIKKKYIDTLRQKVFERYPKDNLKKARALISISSVDLDYAYNTLSDPKTTMTVKDRRNMVENAIKNYKEGIRIYNYLNLNNHDYLPRYFDLQSWILYGNKEYKKALGLIDKAIKSYADDTFLQEGFVANDYRLIASIRFKVLVMDKLRNEEQNAAFNQEYLQSLLLYEKLWESYLLDQIKEPSDFVSNMYNQNPYLYLFEYYAQLYNQTKERDYLKKAHRYEEKSKYGSLLTNLSLSDAQKRERDELARLKTKINVLLDGYYLASFLDKPAQENLKVQIQKTINQFNELRRVSHMGDPLKIITLDSIQQQLDFDKALISYNYIGLGKSKLYAKVITKNKAHLIFIGKPENSGIKNYRYLADSLYQSLEHSDIGTFKTLSFKLYKNLFEPLEDALSKPIKKIEILPFSDIENLPFDLMLTNRTTSLDFRKLPYLAKEYTFSYSLSASVKQLSVKDQKTYGSNLAIFKPVFKNSTQSELNYANKVTDELTHDLDASLFFNEKATLDNFKKCLLDSRIVTLISHGSSSNSIKPTDKGVYLQDGFLSMDKVYEIDAKTDFLVLTACQTGSGFVDRGEGNVNLVRAFRSIGIKSILNANWEIDEKTTMDILKVFFKYLKMGMDKSEALKRAKMDYLNSCIPRYANPIYWAGLNIVGDSSPMIFKAPEPDSAKSMWWTLVLIPVLGIFYWFKKFH